MPSTMLESLICKHEEELCDDEVVKAVSCIGKHVGKNGRQVWVIDRDTAIDENGKLVTDLEPYGLIWISHLIEGNSIDIAKEEFKRDFL